MRSITIALIIGLLILTGCAVGCGSKSISKSETTAALKTTAVKELQFTNVQFFPRPNTTPLQKDVTLKVTNPNTDYYSKFTKVKVILYDSQGKIVGTDDSDIWTVYPGSSWRICLGIPVVGEPTKVEAQPSTENWLKIAPADIPKFTITQSTTSGTHTVGSVRYEGSYTPAQIEMVGVALDANGSVVNYGLAHIENPTIGDNPFDFLWFIEGGPTAPPEFTFELVGG
jgi:hypothetical protein